MVRRDRFKILLVCRIEYAFGYFKKSILKSQMIGYPNITSRIIMAANPVMAPNVERSVSPLL